MNGRGPAPTRRERELASLLGVDRLCLFVPALMSVGLLFWLVSEVAEVLRSRAEETRLRRATALAGGLAAELDGRPVPGAAGLRPRPAYVVVGVTSLVAAAYVVVGSVANYVKAGGYVAGEAHLLALAGVAGALGAYVGVAALTAAVTWPSPPAWVQGLLLRTPLGTTAAEGVPTPSWRTWTALLATGGLLAALTALVAWSPEIVERANRESATWFHQHELPPGLAVLGPSTSAGRVLWIALAVLSLLAALRCRVVALGSVVAGIAVAVAAAALGPLVARARAVEELTPSSSYPEVAVALTVLVAGVAPLALAVARRSPKVSRGVSALLFAAAVLAVVGALHEASSATDVVGGMVLGSVAVVALRAAVASGRLHSSCPDCPWGSGTPPERSSWAVRLRRVRPDGVTVAHLASAAATVVLGAALLVADVGTHAPGAVVVRLGLTLVMSVGVVLSWRRPGAGAAVITLAVLGTGSFLWPTMTPLLAVGLVAVLAVAGVAPWIATGRSSSQRTPEPGGGRAR